MSFSGNVTKINGGAIPAPNVTGEPLVDLNHLKGGAIPAPNVTGEPLVDVNHWRGTQPNVLQSGRVDAYVGAFAAGSGFHTQNNQRSTVSITGNSGSNTWTIGSAVTLARTRLADLGVTCGGSPASEHTYWVLTNTTTATLTRLNTTAGDTSTASAEAEETA